MSVRGIDIAIVGGGMSGLYTLKHLLEAMRSGGSARASTALDDAVAVFESSDGIGGVWRYQPNAAGGVHRSTHTTRYEVLSLCPFSLSDRPIHHSQPKLTAVSVSVVSAALNTLCKSLIFRSLNQRRSSRITPRCIAI